MPGSKGCSGSTHQPFVHFGRIQLGVSNSPKGALKCSADSCHLRTKLGSIANLAFLRLWIGDVASAAEHCKEGMSLGSNIAEIRLALLETQAQVMLVNGDGLGCRELLSEVERNYSHDRRFQPTWYQLATALTRARVQLKGQEWHEAVSTCQSAAKLSDRRGDRLHGISLRVLGADALLELDRLDEADAWIREAAELATNMPIAAVRRGRARRGRPARPYCRPAAGETSVRARAAAASSCRRHRQSDGRSRQLHPHHEADQRAVASSHRHNTPRSDSPS